MSPQMLTIAMICLLGPGCRCVDRPKASATVAGRANANPAITPDQSDRDPNEHATIDPVEPDDAGTRDASATQIAHDVDEAESLATAWLQGGIEAREVASTCDARGHRLYSQRHFRRAQVWFDRALKADASYELARFNAARTAWRLGDEAAHHAHLRALRALGTPLAKRLDRYFRKRFANK